MFFKQPASGPLTRIPGSSILLRLFQGFGSGNSSGNEIKYPANCASRFGSSIPGELMARLHARRIFWIQPRLRRTASRGVALRHAASRECKMCVEILLAKTDQGTGFSHFLRFCHQTWATIKSHVIIRVTRLGEFSPIGWLFTLGSFF
jgi:hypothetical protein